MSLALAVGALGTFDRGTRSPEPLVVAGCPAEWAQAARTLARTDPLEHLWSSCENRHGALSHHALMAQWVSNAEGTCRNVSPEGARCHPTLMAQKGFPMWMGA